MGSTFLRRHPSLLTCAGCGVGLTILVVSSEVTAGMSSLRLSGWSRAEGVPVGDPCTPSLCAVFPWSLRLREVGA